MKRPIVVRVLTRVLGAGTTIRDLEYLADRIYTAVRQGHSLPAPGDSVHRQVVEEMGGPHWWQELQDDFDRLAGPR